MNMNMNMKTQIFLFRHGQTDWNKEGRFQGHTDIPLNQTGIEEAIELMSYIERIRPELIVSSDLQRAIKTAEIVNKNLNLRMQITDSLRETNLGEAEGRYRSEVDQIFGAEAMAQWISIDPQTLDFGFPSGESKKQVITRVLNYLESVITKNPVQKLAVSTHGGVIKRICHHISNLPTESIPIKNCCLYELEYSHAEKQWRFISQHK
jgi:broad specificity phosphatase PhoE